MKRRTLTTLMLLLALAVAAPAVAEAHTLGYTKAKRAAKAKANRFAGQSTRVTTLMRLSQHRWYAQAEWGEYCFVELNVKFRSKRSRRVVAQITGSYCP